MHSRVPPSHFITRMSAAMAKGRDPYTLNLQVLPWLAVLSSYHSLGERLNFLLVELQPFFHMYISMACCLLKQNGVLSG